MILRDDDRPIRLRPGKPPVARHEDTVAMGLPAGCLFRRAEYRLYCMGLAGLAGSHRSRLRSDAIWDNGAFLVTGGRFVANGRHKIGTGRPVISENLLNSLLRRLIVRSFPSLRRHVILIAWANQDELLCYSVHGQERWITVSDYLKQARCSAIEGGIAHELCHIELELCLGPYQRGLAWERYSRSRWHRIREERYVEARAIELGYRDQLLELIRFTRRLGFTFDREHGLSYAEILRPESISEASSLRAPIRSRRAGALTVA